MQSVNAEVSHLSIFRLIAQIPSASDLSDVHIFPNPYKPGDSNFAGEYIIFKGLTSEAKIKIYNIAGELIFETDKNDETDQYKWKAVNNSGEKIASGVYICHITNPKIFRQKTVKKVTIIR